MASLPLAGPRNPGPLYCTPRDPSRDTLGPQVAQVLARSGSQGNTQSSALLPVMPWQRDVLDITCEIDPRTGLYWYRTVILIVVRQAGKTTLTRGKLNHRAITQANSRLLYTAQDRNKGRQRLEETIYNPLKASLLGGQLLKPHWGNGNEAIRWINGSKLRTEALSPTSGHGDTLDEAHIDEAFAHRDNRIEQNVTPTMVTVAGSQKWITSAAGDLNSNFLRDKRDAGRAMVEAGGASRTCYIEFSAPLDADPDDPETVLNCHPAIGHIIDLETIQDDKANMNAEEFQRAYYGWWPNPLLTSGVIPVESWEQNYVLPTEDAWDGEPLWSVDVSPDREWASIGLAAVSSVDARCFLELIEQDLGTAWVINRLLRLREKFGGWRVALDGSGAASSLQTDLEEAGFEVVLANSHDKAVACGAFYDDVVQARVRYLNDPLLNKAVRSAVWMPVFSGEARIFSRGKSLADITPLYAVALARWAYVKFAPDMYDVMDSIA